jgi:hypothetical protein
MGRCADRTIIRFAMVGKWTWEELYDVYQDTWDEVAHIGHRVDAIADMTGTNYVPPGTITQVRSFANKRPDNTGVIVFAGANTYVTAIMETVKKLFKMVGGRTVSVHFAHTLDEAREIIAQARDSIK